MYISEEDHTTGRVPPKASKPMRDIIAKAIKADPVKYNSGMLEGKSNAEYTTWIQSLDSWGGGIELSILSPFYQVEINVLDIKNNRMNRFGEDKHFKKRWVSKYISCVVIN